MKPSDHRSSECTKLSPWTAPKLSSREMGNHKTTRLLVCCVLDQIWYSTQRLEDLDWFRPEMAYVLYGGWCSCSIALEPGCSKFRGELTSWSSSVEPVRVQPFPMWGAFPFIAQGGAPIYRYLALCLGTIGAQIVLVSRRGPPGRSGVGELDLGDILVEGMILAISLGGAFPWCCPILAQSGWRDHSDGRSGVSSGLVRRSLRPLSAGASRVAPVT